MNTTTKAEKYLKAAGANPSDCRVAVLQVGDKKSATAVHRVRPDLVVLEGGPESELVALEHEYREAGLNVMRA